MTASNLFDFAMITIFAREFLEGSIVIGEYRTIIRRSDSHRILAPNVTKDDALAAVTISALAAIAFALFVIACVAIPLAILSSSFNANTGYIIEGISKIVAAVSLLMLSLNIPKLLGLYGTRNKSVYSLFVKKQRRDDIMDESLQHTDAAQQEQASPALSLQSIRFNVAWNIWREVAEIGAFLLPSFLSNSNLQKLPLSALVGAIVGTLVGVAIFICNKRLKNRKRLCVFVVLLLVILSAGLYTGGSHKLETVIGETKEVWALNDEFWSVDRLPMTLIKPFGYSDTRTVLELVSFWGWLALSTLLHYRKYVVSPKGVEVTPTDHSYASDDVITDEEKGGENSSNASQTMNETVQSSSVSLSTQKVLYNV